MKKTNSKLAYAILPLALSASLFMGGCTKQAPQQAETPQQQAAPTPQPAPTPAPTVAPQPPAPAPAPEPTRRHHRRSSGDSADTAATSDTATASSYTIPAGTRISITTGETLSSKTNQSGDTFQATVAEAVRSNGRVLVPAGSQAQGTVVTAKSLGRFKGQATLALRLDSVTAHGQTYNVETSSIDRVEKGKGKRTAVLAGGGGGLGALIGGLAGGGKGALIGALAGAGAGTAGTAFTGNKEIVIPAETQLTFKLENSVTVNR